MTVRKRITKKTGNGSIRTTTLSSTGGKTESYSNRPTKQSPRRTVSFNHKTGKTRTTYSQELGGGYTRITSKTTGGSKTKTSTSSGYRKRSRSKASSMSGTDSILLLLLSVPLLVIMYLWPVTIPYIAGLVGSVLLIIVVINLVFFVLPYVIWGSILFGLYYIVKVIL